MFEEIQRRIGRNTYVIKIGRNRLQDRVYNISNMYPYVNRMAQEEERGLVGVEGMKESEELMNGSRTNIGRNITNGRIGTIPVRTGTTERVIV